MKDVMKKPTTDDWQIEWDAMKSAFERYEFKVQPYMNVPRIVDEEAFKAGWKARKEFEKWQMVERGE